MMAFIYILLLLAILLAWAGFRRATQYCFAVTFVLSIIWFARQMTSMIGLRF